MNTTAKTTDPQKCRNCDGSRWTARGLCHACENVVPQSQKDALLDRVAKGQMTASEATAELDELEKSENPAERRACFESRRGLTRELRSRIDRIQSYALRGNVCPS